MANQEILAKLRRRVAMLRGAETHIPIPVEWVRELVAVEPPETPGEPSSEESEKPKRRTRKPKPAE